MRERSTKSFGSLEFSQRPSTTRLRPLSTLAPVFTTTNIACDHNQLTMEMMQKIARKHGMVCLLHEKPFAGVNGSGKAQQLVDLDEHGHQPSRAAKLRTKNAQFLLFLVAVIKAVDDYQDLLRISVASVG